MISKTRNSNDSSASRRKFMKVSTTVLAGGITMTNRRNALNAQGGASDLLRIGLIGCGGRGTGAASQALRADKNVKLTAMGDAFADRIQTSLDRLKKMDDIASKINVCIPITPDELDSNPMLLTVKNGTINLETCEFYPSRREDFITKVAPVEYDENATCPRFEKFLYEILDADFELIDFVQRAMGYSLTGDISEHCML